MNNTTSPTIETTDQSVETLRICTAILGILVYTTGFIGNFLSFLLFIQKDLRQVSTGLIFLLLNIFSTIHLLSLLIESVDSIFQIVIIPNSVLRCQFILWLQNATRTICSFLAATVSVDRFIRSEYPMKSRVWCTTKNVTKLLALYCLFSTVFYLFFFDSLNVFNSYGQCSFPYPGTFRLFALNILPPIRFLLICVIPVVLMIGCSTRMLLNIRKTKTRVAPQTTTPAQLGIGAVVPPPSAGNNMMEESRRKKTTIDSMLLLMVLANILAYILTQLPFNIYTLYYGYETLDDYTIYSLIRAFLLMWSSIYFGIGFYLFCIASPQFRKQFFTKMKTLVTAGNHRLPSRERI